MGIMTDTPKTPAEPVKTEAATDAPAEKTTEPPAASAVEPPAASVAEPFVKPPVPKPMDVEEIGGPPGPEPTRYGDWQFNGKVTDF